MEADIEKAKIEVERLKKKESAIRETRQNLEALLRKKNPLQRLTNQKNVRDRVKRSSHSHFKLIISNHRWSSNHYTLPLHRLGG